MKIEKVSQKIEEPYLELLQKRIQQKEGGEIEDLSSIGEYRLSESGANGEEYVGARQWRKRNPRNHRHEINERLLIVERLNNDERLIYRGP